MTNDVTIPTFPVGYRIRLALEVSGVEFDDVAARLGVHTNTLWNWISGRTKPRRMALAMIADLTGVPLAWLEGREPAEADTEVVTDGELLVAA